MSAFARRWLVVFFAICTLRISSQPKRQTSVAAAAGLRHGGDRWLLRAINLLPFTITSADNLCKAAYTHDAPWWYWDDHSLNWFPNDIGLMPCKLARGTRFVPRIAANTMYSSCSPKLPFHCARAPLYAPVLQPARAEGRTPVARNGYG